MFRLPDGWTGAETITDTVVADGLRLRRAGVIARAPTGEQVFGAAASRRDGVVSRAWFELAERVCVVNAAAAARSEYRLLTRSGRSARAMAPAAAAFPRARASWVPARSNGAAIHVDWARACERASWELVERDRVLRTWLGEAAAPRALPRSPSPRSRTYEWRAYSFSPGPSCVAPGLAVVGVFGFPVSDRQPVVVGFAARPDLAAARRSATGEALQQLAFLWDAPVPRRAPRRSPPTPRLHLDTYQRPAGRAVLRRWLEEGHLHHRASGPAPRPPRAAVRFIDLTPSWLSGKARVAKALSEGVLPFGFGELPSARVLPPALRIHPIP